MVDATSIMLMAGTVVTGVFGRGVIDRIQVKFGNGKNGNGNGNGKDRRHPGLEEVAMWSGVMRTQMNESIENELKVSVVPILNAQTDILKQIAGTNSKMSDSIIELVSLQRASGRKR